VQRASGIPHALKGERSMHDSGALRCEIANAYLDLERRHCEERLVRRSSTSEGGSDCQELRPLAIYRELSIASAKH
jgi:hypothetical protein